MKRFAFALLFTLIAIEGYSQDFAIIDHKSNVLYDIIHNEVEVFVKGNYDSVYLTCDSSKGIIESNWWRGRTIFYVFSKVKDYDSNGVKSITLTAYGIKNKKAKIIGKKNFIIEDYPDVAFKIGPCGDMGHVRENVLVAQQYVRAELENTDYDLHLSVKQFSMVILRNDTALYTKTLQENKIDSTTSAMFATLQPGDLIMFYNIWCGWPDGHLSQLPVTRVYIKKEDAL